MIYFKRIVKQFLFLLGMKRYSSKIKSLIQEELSNILEKQKLNFIDVGGAVNLQPHHQKLIGNANFYIFEPDNRSYNDLVATVDRHSHPEDFFYIKTILNNNLTVNPIIQYSFLSREPHIFFGGPVSPTFTDRPPYIYYYQYVVYNSGYGNSKKAKFNQLIGAEFVNSFSVKENVLIRQIPEDALIKLRDFIFDQRKQDPTFCKTIFNAVVEVVGPPQQNNQ